MLGIMAQNGNILYRQVNKTKARNIFNDGGGIAICGSKQRTVDLYPIYDADGLVSFDSVVNSWVFYNKQYYGYPRFYEVENMD